MDVWKKTLLPVVLTCGSVGWLVATAAGPVLRGEPLNPTFLIFTIVFFTSTVLFLALGRKGGPTSS